MKSLALVSFLIAVIITPVSLNAKIKPYSSPSGWRVFSVHSDQGGLAIVCAIQSKSMNFFLGYSGERGWEITAYYNKKVNLQTGDKLAVLYVDNRYISTVQGQINNNKRSIQIPLGLNTQVLNPILKGRQLLISVSGLKLRVNLIGIKRAYHDALGCWRRRMNSMPYLAEKHDQDRAVNKSNYDSGKAKALEVLNRMELAKQSHNFAAHLSKNVDGYNFGLKTKKENQNQKGLYSSEVELIVDDGDNLVVGSVDMLSTSNDRLSLGTINGYLNKAITSYMTYCDKSGIENKKPYFIGQSVEVHHRVMYCSHDKMKNSTVRVWLLQSDKYLMIANIFLPNEISDLIEENLFTLTIENIANDLAN